LCAQKNEQKDTDRGSGVVHEAFRAKSHLKAPCGYGMEQRFASGDVSQGFQESECQVFTRAHPLGEKTLEQTAFADHLLDGVCNLQEIVEYLGGIGVLCIAVLQSVSCVFPCVEAFIFNFPSDSDSFIGFFVLDISVGYAMLWSLKNTPEDVVGLLSE